MIKPEVGAGSFGACVFGVGDPAAAAHLATLTARGAALVQPYIDSVDDYGERSMIYIDGELSHTIRKTPRFAGQSESVTGPHPIADDERAVALMELELVEPSLSFAKQPGSADRFVAGLHRWF